MTRSSLRQMLTVILGVFVVLASLLLIAWMFYKGVRKDSASSPISQSRAAAGTGNQATLNPVIVRRGRRHNDNSHHRVLNAKFPERQFRTGSDNPRKSLSFALGELSRRSKPATDS
jgi:hypothetical protein